MVKSGAIDLLRSFSRRELKEFSLFVISPFHNTDQSVVRLFSFIKKYYPAFDDKDLSKEKLFEEVYTGKEYNEQTLKSVLFNLAGCIKEYLVLNRVNKDPVKKNLLLADELLERESLKLLGKITKIAVEMENSKGINKEGFYNLHYIDYLKWQAASFTYDHTGLIGNFINKSNHFLLYMIMELMYDVNTIDTFKFNHNTDFRSLPVSKFLNNLDIQSLLKDLNKADIKYSYILEMSLSITMFLAGNYDEKLYIKASMIFKKNVQAFERNEIYGISTMLINMCRKFERTDEEKYTREKFDIYKLQLEKNAYSSYPNAPLTVDKFRNIVNAALYLKELKWTEEFISEYKEKLPENLRDDVAALAVASLHAEKGEFEAALKITARVKIEYFAYKPDLKLLQLRCFYELGYTEEAFSSADALRHFLKSQSLSSTKQNTIQKFLDYYIRLLKLNLSKDKHSSTVLIRDINNEHLLSSKNWFLKKISEI